jgi:GNAT superfamily N-acetyltransferase
MKITSFQPADRAPVLKFHAEEFARFNLKSFIWQPCQQIESMETDCCKYVCRDATVRGYAAAYSLDATHARLNLLVDARHRRQRVGTLLLETIETSLKNQGRVYIQARLLEGMDGPLAFALARGFQEIHRMRGMSLHAENFSFEKWKNLGERLSAEGFRVTTFKDEDEAGNAPVKRLAELYKRAREGWPLPDPTCNHEMPEEWFSSSFINLGAPEHLSIMKVAEEYVGFTSADKTNAAVGTGVHPHYRGRGVATYLKAVAIQACIAAGQKYFESASANAAMHRVNEKLGYRFNALTEIRLLKRL